MLKIRRSRDRLIFNMEDVLYIEMEPWSQWLPSKMICENDIHRDYVVMVVACTREWRTYYTCTVYQALDYFVMFATPNHNSCLQTVWEIKWAVYAHILYRFVLLPCNLFVVWQYAPFTGQPWTKSVASEITGWTLKFATESRNDIDIVSSDSWQQSISYWSLPAYWVFILLTTAYKLQKWYICNHNDKHEYDLMYP